MAEAPWDGPAEPVAASYFQRLLVPLLLVITAGGLVALLEVDRLLSAIVVPVGDREGETASMAQATGLSSWTHHEQVWQVWQAWAITSEQKDQIADLVGLYVVFDAVFIAGYLAILALVMWRSRFCMVTLGVLFLAEGAEGWAAIAAAHELDSKLFPVVVAVSATVKWAALAAAFVGMFAVRATRVALAVRARRALTAGRVHALGLIFLVGLGALSLVSSSGIFDQLPDVQRQWVNDRGIAAGPLWSAVAAMVVAALLLWLLGRRRSEIARRVSADWTGLGDAKVGWWVAAVFGALWLSVVAWAATASVGWAWAAAVVGGVIVMGVAVLADVAVKAWPAARGRSILCWAIVCVLAVALTTVVVLALGGREHLWPAAVVAALAAVVVVGSWVLDKRHPEPMVLHHAPAYSNQPLAERTTWLVGDAIAVLVLALAPLGLIRSFLAPVIAEYLELVPASALAAAAVGLLLAAMVGAIAVPVVLLLGVWAFDRFVLGPEEAKGFWSVVDPRVPSAANGWRTTVWNLVPIVVGAVIVAIAVIDPVLFARLGPVAVTVLLLTGWGLMVGGVILALQRRRPMRLFRQLGLTSTPVIALILVCGVITATWLTPSALHAVRVSTADGEPQPILTADGTDDERFTRAIDERFARWEQSADECTVAGTNRTVKPLLLIAAEGGGGRAAYWTVQALNAFDVNTGRDGRGDYRRDAAPVTCLAGAPFAASGISGGTVGLVVDRVSGTPGADIVKLMDPEPLARLVTGMLAGDLVAGFTGAMVPTVDGVWNDRAGLIEHAWEEHTGGDDSPLRARFTREPAPDGARGAGSGDDAPLPPFLLLNSAEAVSGCRITIVQLDAAAPTPAPTPTSEPTPTPTPSKSEKPRSSPLSPDECGRGDRGASYALAFDDVWACSTSLRWSSAAMISARFPFVTPGGRMPVPNGAECSGAAPGTPHGQLVDGGYSDDTGLASLVDLLPELLPLVRAHNAQAGTTEVLPIVMYLKNERGFELDAAVTAVAAELLVPLAGWAARSQQNREAALLERLADQLETVDIDGGLGAFERSRLVVVHTDTVPTVIPPLGWTLSSYSQKVLNDGIQAQLCLKEYSKSPACSVDSAPTDPRRLSELFEGFTDPAP